MARTLKWILTMEQLLLEKDNRKTIKDTFKFPDEIADWAHNMSEKYSVWIANVLHKELVRIYTEGRGFNSGRATNTGLPEHYKLDEWIKKYWREILPATALENRIRYAVDWLASPRRDQTQKLNLKTLTLDDAARMSDEWHKSLKASGKIVDESGDVFLTFPDGYYWIDLKTNDCQAEGEAMGHCARTGRDNVLWSLRDKSKEPHVTVAYNSKGKFIAQIKGKQNKKPVEKYHPYILELLLNIDDDEHRVDTFLYEYSPKDDFKISDLEKSDRYKLFSGRPDMVGLQLSICAGIVNRDMSPEDGQAKLPDTLKRVIEMGPKSLRMSVRVDHISSMFSPSNRHVIEEVLADKIPPPKNYPVRSTFYDRIDSENHTRIAKWMVGKTIRTHDSAKQDIVVTSNQVSSLKIADLATDRQYDNIYHAIALAARAAMNSHYIGDVMGMIENGFEEAGMKFTVAYKDNSETKLDKIYIDIPYDIAIDYLTKAGDKSDAGNHGSLGFFCYEWADIMGGPLEGTYNTDLSVFDDHVFNKYLSDELDKILK